MHHSRRKSRRFVYRTGGFIVLLRAAHGSIFPFRCTGRRSDSPAARRGRAARSGGPIRSGSARTGRSSRSRPAYSAGRRAAERATCRRQAGARSPRRRRTGAERPAHAAEPRRARPYRSRRGAEKENAPSGHEVFKAFRDDGFNDDLRHVSSSVKHNGMVLSRVAPLYTLERKCKLYRSMGKRTKNGRNGGDPFTFSLRDSRPR